MRIFSVLIALALSAVFIPHTVRAGTIYAVDGMNDEIVTIDLLTGSEQKRFLTPEPSSGGPDGLAMAEAAMFFVNGNGSNMITRLDPMTGMVTGSFPAPEQFGGSDGLAIMDDTLFTLEPASDTIHRIRISTGESLGSCSTGLFAGGGLAAEDGRLFATLGLVNIVELNPESCELISGPFPVPGNDMAFGLAFDGEFLYVGSINQPGIHSLDPDTGRALGFLPLEYAPTGLAATAEPEAAVCALELDYRPGSTANILNLRSRGQVPVAVYGTDADASGDLDQNSLTLSNVTPEHVAYEDVDGDGILDLILHLRTQALIAALTLEHGELQDGMVLEVALDGERMDGTPCRGEDSIRIRQGETGRNHESRGGHHRRGSR